MRRRRSAALDRLGVTLDLDAPLETLPIAAAPDRRRSAAALVGDARLIFMDEPTASLTQSETDSLLDIVRALSADGVAVVFVSHRLAEVLEICARVTVLRDGRLVGVYPTAGMTQSRLTELMTGRTFDSDVVARDRVRRAGRCSRSRALAPAASSRTSTSPSAGRGRRADRAARRRPDRTRPHACSA